MLAARSVVWLTGLLALALGAAASGGCGGDDTSDGRSGSGGGGRPVAGTGGVSAGGAGGGAGTAGGAAGDEFDAGSEPDRNMVSAGELCDRLSTIQCAAEAHCCDTASRDFAACKTANLTMCNGGLMLDTIAADPRVGFNEAAASASFMAYETKAKACDATLPSWAASNAGFMSSFTGTVAADGDCMPEGGLGGELAEVFAALASCDRAAGLACLPSSTAWKCSAPSPMGGPCYSDFNCATGLYCEGAGSSDFDGTCAPIKQAGAACGLPTECASLVCTGSKCGAAGDDQAVFCPG
jgi:hypothetical protein